MLEQSMRPGAARSVEAGGNEMVSLVHRKEINLAGIDLNLLVALEALLTERNVTIAAGRVGLSQPAMSRALGRLRDLFEDDLLVRSSNGFQLTRRAEYLAQELPHALSTLRTLIGNAGPAKEAKSRLVVAMPDHQALILLPRLSDRLRLRAPHIDLVTQPNLAATARRLERGEIDLAIGSMSEIDAAGFYRRLLYTDRFACVVRNNHPILEETWCVERFAALRHAVVTPAAEDGFAQIYEQITELQCIGWDPLVVPNAMAAPFMIADTDIALILPMRVARRAATLLPLAVLEVPIELPPYEVFLHWHELRHRDADCARLRTEIAAVALAAVTEFAGATPLPHSHPPIACGGPARRHG
jgi:DNA-binding transcriptional LysR family regulator